MEEKPLKEWDSNVFDCFEDPQTCCYGCWCGPCLACTVTGRFGENRWLPLIDICSNMLYFGSPIFVPPAALTVRVAMRNKYGIKGSILEDIAISCCCATCSWCQMHRELKSRKQNPVIINTLSQNVVSMQPAAVMMPVNPLPVPTVQAPLLPNY
ncbi:cornifelin homolog B [Austrofundulus limnaeus]|uniref:Cornifelin homolog B n=1 Tax=Austrofundulus limnaeus TaxID=52670 RepID=A0A2I4BPS4_AUSLI|nr:PREDICTED: cornifelin homolog B-like [Austrofundulus limnaeus]